VDNFNIRTNMSVRRGINLNIDIRGIHKGEVFFFLHIHLERLINILK
jgi:hypothetical protein